jgi:hypothetical protein
MTDLLAACLAFPTVIYSLLLSVVLIYWTFVVLGALDINMLEVDADGLLDGAGDGVAGALDGAGHGVDALDGVGHGLEGAAHGLEGAGHAAGEAAGEGAGQAAGKVAGEALVEAGGGALTGMVAALKLRRVPATVVISFTVLFAWGITLTAMDLVGGLAASIPGGMWLLGGGITVGALVLALPLTSVAITPFARFFATHGARGRHELVGNSCIVSTGRVDAKFGQAYCRMGHDELLIPVRCDHANTLAKGREALIIDYDQARQAFVVEPVDA